jgi:hypothetical protein
MKRVFRLLGAVIVVGAVCSAATAEANDSLAMPTPQTSHVVYPLKVSPNHRYMVEQRGVLLIIVGDSSQSFIGNVFVSESVLQFSYLRRNRSQSEDGTIWCPIRTTHRHSGI